MTALERRYRRLLDCYPAAYRAEYAEEMVGVLMAKATPGQRYPNLREALDLLASGVRARLGTPLRASRTPAWREAAGVFGFLGSVATAAVLGYPVVAGLVWRHFGIGSVSRAALVVALVWTVPPVLAGLGWWRLAAAGAGAGALAETAALALRYRDDPTAFLTSWWQLVLAVTVAVVLAVRARAVAAQPAGEPGRPLGVRATVAVAGAGLLVLAVPLADLLNMRVTEETPGVWHISERVSWPAFLDGRPVPGTLLLVTCAVIVLRLRPAIRRRVLLLLTPAATAVLLGWQTFAAFPAFPPGLWPPSAVAPQWAALVGTPVLTFALAAWLVARYERRRARRALLAEE